MLMYDRFIHFIRVAVLQGKFSAGFSKKIYILGRENDKDR